MKTSLLTPVLLAAALIVSAYGCGPRHPYFNLSQERYVMKAGSLAVISGENRPASIGLAAFVTSELQKKSTFRILSQQEISKRIPDYTDQILETRDDKKALKMLHDKLKTDYLFVVWAESLTKGVMTTSNLAIFFTGLGGLEADINGQLFRYPDETEIGNTLFKASCSLGVTTFDAADSDNEAAGKMLQEAAASIANDFLDVTKSAKTAR